MRQGAGFIVARDLNNQFQRIVEVL
jgi:hypothetical protein